MKLFGIVGWKNSGKTGLTTRLIAHFSATGLSVASLKHAHHSFDIDRPDTDSFRHREAGAEQVLIASDKRWALMREGQTPGFADLVSQLGPADLVLVEGWKHEPIPKIECHRSEAQGNGPLLAPEDPFIKAVASDASPEVSCPLLELDDTDAIAAFIAGEINL